MKAINTMSVPREGDCRERVADGIHISGETRRMENRK